MAEYINKEEAKKALYSTFAFHSYGGGMAANVLDEVPAANVRENVKGEWVHVGTHEYECSMCHERIWNPCFWIEKYCFNCGADMGIKEDDSTMISLEKAKKVIKDHYVPYGIFNTHNTVGDPMTTIYRDEKIRIDVCHYYGYFEVFGLTSEEFKELEKFYASAAHLI